MVRWRLPRGSPGTGERSVDIAANAGSTSLGNRASTTRNSTSSVSRGPMVPGRYDDPIRTRRHRLPGGLRAVDRTPAIIACFLDLVARGQEIEVEFAGFRRVSPSISDQGVERVQNRLSSRALAPSARSGFAFRGTRRVCWTASYAADESRSRSPAGRNGKAPSALSVVSGSTIGIGFHPGAGQLP